MRNIPSNSRYFVSFPKVFSYYSLIILMYLNQTAEKSIFLVRYVTQVKESSGDSSQFMLLFPYQAV